MQKFINFWQKDIINKLIILNLILLIIGIISITVLINKMPEGKSVPGLVDDLFPTPTIPVSVLLTQAVEKQIIAVFMATASAPPTITTMPLAQFVKTATRLPKNSEAVVLEEPATETAVIIPSVIPSPSATITLPTPTMQVIIPTIVKPTSTSAITASLPLPTSTPSAASLGISCIPGTKPEAGKVLSVLDGVTLRVMIEEKTYNVRLIGLEQPVNKNFRLMAGVTGGKLMFGLDVLLYKDTADKDGSGYLVRYVKQGDTFINLEMIKRGLATTIDSSPNNACAGLFKQAEDDARSKDIGLWLLHPTVTKP